MNLVKVGRALLESSSKGNCLVRVRPASSAGVLSLERMPRIKTACSFVSLVLLFTGIVVFAESTERCPTFCVCDTWYGLRRASCTGRHLYSIHTGVSSAVEALDLANNSISSLGNFELASAGLRGLRYLNLSGNAISEIDLNAFGDLTELTVLDLSSNHLYYILSDVFIENTKLRIVKLSRNNFNSQTPKLRCPHLTTLTLASCQISHIPLDTFKHVNGLMNLDLSNNLMIQIDSVVFQPLHSLRMIALEGNPWSCNKLLLDVQLYLRHRGVEFETICGKNPEPKKFEKMIIAPTNREDNHHKSIAEDEDSEDAWNIPNLSIDPNTTYIQENNGNIISEVSPYWFLATGFILGSAVTLIITYLWLHKSIYCSQSYISRERIGADSQRLSLLSSLWQYEDGTVSENGGPTVSRAGTPPPAYREVMLRPSLYSCPSSGQNFNGNATGHRERFA